MMTRNHTDLSPGRHQSPGPWLLSAAPHKQTSVHVKEQTLLNTDLQQMLWSKPDTVCLQHSHSQESNQVSEAAQYFVKYLPCVQLSLPLPLSLFHFVSYYFILPVALQGRDPYPPLQMMKQTPREDKDFFKYTTPVNAKPDSLLFTFHSLIHTIWQHHLFHSENLPKL